MRLIPLIGSCAALCLAPIAQAERYAQHKAGDYPPHHRLWACIARPESGGNPQATNGRYRGYLQLHYGWGYGSSYDAAQDSQTSQEWAAERAYRASGFSRSFLAGQWLNYDGAWGCLAYA